MKKVALIYSGQPRHLRECYANHKKNFYESNPDWEVDVFAHIWYDESWVGSYFWDSYKNRGKWDADLIPYIEENWNPKALEFEEPKDFESDWQPDQRFPHPVNNIISMFYSLEKANNLKRKYEEENNFKYDCVVRLRTDEFFYKDIGSLNNYNLNTVNVHNEYAHLDYGINDHFAFGSSELMDKYLSVCSNLETIINEGAAINPETLIGWNAQEHHKLPITKNKFAYRLWRDM
jgi:hypothetical protein